MGMVLAVALVVLVAIWWARPMRPPAPEPGEEREPVDVDELEAAEREVRDLDLHQQPEDGYSGDDWGPGTARGKR
jgi:hypothetical protein